MVSNRIKELTATKAKVAALEASIAAERNAVLATLPAHYGFDDVNAFVDAVLGAAGKRRGRKSSTIAQTGRKPRKNRAVITDATRAAVKKLAAAGTTGAAIAKELNISLPSVQNIKKALGLVKKRKK